MTTSSHSPECRQLMIDYCTCMLTPRVTAGRSPQADTPLMLPCRTRPGPSWPKPCDCLASFRTRPQMWGNPGQLGLRLSAQGRRCAGTRPTRPPSLRTRPQMRGNPTNSAPISPHKATDAGTPATSTPISPHKATDAGTLATSTPISPHKATNAEERGQLRPNLSAQGHRWSVNQHDKAPRRAGTQPGAPLEFRLCADLALS